MVHKIWIFKEKHVLILYYFVLIKAGKGLTQGLFECTHLECTHLDAIALHINPRFV